MRGKNLLGQKFGKLEVVENVGINKHGQRMWRCRCECGTVKIVRGGALRNGHTQSCGCLQRVRASVSNKTHGESRTAEYRIWKGLRSRCLNENGKRFHDYGGRGIKVCDRWRDSFENFLADMGRRPSPKHSIDRIDNDGPYSPENCRWATDDVQRRNHRHLILITIDGETRCVADWATHLGIPRDQIYWRLRKGLTGREAVFGR